MPDLSILIPHKHEPENDKALQIALACIVANTRCDFELLIDTTTPCDPYVALNAMARAARSPWLFFSNSDIFPAPSWDEHLLIKARRGALVTATLVEPGAIGVHEQNIHRKFGMTPDTFQRPAFEAFAESKPELPAGDGFYYYLMVHRSDFLDFGGFDTSLGPFPTPLDIFFWEKWLKAGKLIKRSAALVYHLQNYSNSEEQIKAVRHASE